MLGTFHVNTPASLIVTTLSEITVFTFSESPINSVLNLVENKVLTGTSISKICVDILSTAQSLYSIKTERK